MTILHALGWAILSYIPSVVVSTYIVAHFSESNAPTKKECLWIFLPPIVPMIGTFLINL